LLRFVYAEELSVKVPAGTRTTLLAGAELRADVMLAAVTEPPLSVLHAAVVQFDQLPLGTPPGIPALDQFVALAGARIPDQFCAEALKLNVASNMVKRSRLDRRQAERTANKTALRLNTRSKRSWGFISGFSFNAISSTTTQV
jgi:hypothetical protein